jgi:hypothetical protein
MQQAIQRVKVAAMRLAWYFKSSMKVLSMAFTLVLLAFFFVANNCYYYVNLYFLVFFAWKRLGFGPQRYLNLCWQFSSSKVA